MGDIKKGEWVTSKRGEWVTSKKGGQWVNSYICLTRQHAFRWTCTRVLVCMHMCVHMHGMCMSEITKPINQSINAT